MPIDTVLLDLGNVLVPFDFQRAAKTFSALTGLDPVDLHPVLTGPKLIAVCAGELHPHQLFDELGAKAGKVLDLQRSEHAWCDIFTPDREMIRFAGGLAAKYPTFLWSNIDPLHRAFLWPDLPELQRFRGLHLSYELGAAKPSPAFYERALAKGKIDPQRAVFVDDVRANLEAARAFGITTVLHTSAASTRKALAELGITA